MIRVRLETKNSRREYAFHRKEVYLGRSPLNDLPIPAKGVSARHAVMRLEGDALFVEDLDSLSGTTLIRARQGQPLRQPVQLQAGDALMLGRHARITFLGAGSEDTLTLHHHPISQAQAPSPDIAAGLLQLSLALQRAPSPALFLRDLTPLLTACLATAPKALSLLRCDNALTQVAQLDAQGQLVDGPLELPENVRPKLMVHLKQGGLTVHPHEGGWRFYCTAADPERPQALVLLIDLDSSKEEDSLARLTPILSALSAMLCALLRQQTLTRQVQTTVAENRYFRDRQRRHYLYKALVTQSPAMRQIYEHLQSLVEHHEPVLITGESGTGKEMIARALHHLGARHEHLMVSQSCADIDPVLLDVELFGSGESTQASRPSVFELAKGGTVFLDEVDRLPPMLQVKLLRVINESEVRRHGEASSRRVRVRLVVATHRELAPLVEDGRFRRDLFMALHKHTLVVPPLRQRREDILPLLQIFMDVFARRYGSAPSTLEPEAQQALLAYTWPGNVRELQSAVELAVLKRRGQVLRAEDFSIEQQG